MTNDGIRREDLSFDSNDGKSTIHALIWWPADAKTRTAPRGIVQIVHGMSEYAGRYDEFARFLCRNGFVVCGDDHIGHGGSCTPDKRGCMPAFGGKKALLADEDKLRALVSDRVRPGTPYFMFGHSMGSYMVRAYLAHYGQGLTGAVICGTGHVPVALSRLGNLLAHVIALFRGQDFRSKLIDGLGAGAYSKQVEGPTGYEWLSYNEKNVTRYLGDELCGFMFSVGGYCALMSLTAEACSRKCVKKTPRNLPLYYIAGIGDPVGDFGKGVRHAAQMQREEGSEDVTIRIYDGMRHEILNEDNRGQVMDDVLAWLDARLQPKTTFTEG